MAQLDPTTPPPPVCLHLGQYGSACRRGIRWRRHRHHVIGRICAKDGFVQCKSRREAAGRDPNQLLFPTAATVSINRDIATAREASKRAICKLYHPIPHPYYDSQLRQMGFEEFADQATQLVPAGKLREAIDLVPEEVVDTMTITGDVKQCAARVREYAASGRHFARTGQRNDTIH